MTDQRPFTGHVFIGTSLDGFIARTNGDLEWLTTRGEAAGEYGFQEFLDSVDTVAMGRVTYGNWLSLGADQWPFRGKQVAVLSTRLDADDDPRIADVGFSCRPAGTGRAGWAAAVAWSPARIASPLANRHAPLGPSRTSASSSA